MLVRMSRGLRVLTLAALAATLLHARRSRASADAAPVPRSTFLSPGILMGAALNNVASGATRDRALLGLEVSLHHYPTNRWLGFGGFAQGELQGNDTRRVAVGAQASYRFIGVELGAGWRGGSDASQNLGVRAHLALYASGGLVSLAIRVSPAFDQRAADIALVATVKWPLAVHAKLASAVPSGFGL